MDPSKSATAPPPEWAGETSTMGHVPPPPYQDNPVMGYPQPGPGYPQPGPGYPQPGPGYPQQPQVSPDTHTWENNNVSLQMMGFSFSPEYTAEDDGKPILHSSLHLD